MVTIYLIFPDCLLQCTRHRRLSSFVREHCATLLLSERATWATVGQEQCKYKGRNCVWFVVNTKFLRLQDLHRYVLTDVYPFQSLYRTETVEEPPCQTLDSEYPDIGLISCILSLLSLCWIMPSQNSERWTLDRYDGLHYSRRNSYRTFPMNMISEKKLQVRIE